MSKKQIAGFAVLFLGLMALLGLFLLRDRPVNNSTHSENESDRKESTSNSSGDSPISTRDRTRHTTNQNEDTGKQMPDDKKTSSGSNSTPAPSEETPDSDSTTDSETGIAIPSGKNLDPAEIQKLAEQARKLLASSSVKERRRGIKLLGKLMEQQKFSSRRFPEVRKQLLQAAASDQDDNLRIFAYQQLIDKKGWTDDYGSVIDSISADSSGRVRKKAIEEYQLELSQGGGRSTGGARFRLDRRGSIRDQFRNLQREKNYDIETARSTLIDRTEKLIQLLTGEINRTSSKSEKDRLRARLNQLKKRKRIIREIKSGEIR